MVEILGDFGEGMELLSGSLSAKNQEEFVFRFKEICDGDLARRARSIVYIWFTVKPIPRLHGESAIVYIGKTNQCFHDRHYRYAKVEGSNLNWKRYEHIIKEFGPIRIACRQVLDPREAEKALLRRYFESQLELPPLNASS